MLFKLWPHYTWKCILGKWDNYVYRHFSCFVISIQHTLGSKSTSEETRGEQCAIYPVGQSCIQEQNVIQTVPNYTLLPTFIYNIIIRGDNISELVMHLCVVRDLGTMLNFVRCCSNALVPLSWVYIELLICCMYEMMYNCYLII